MSTCFPLNSSYSEISNNKYIFNNNYTTNISYGLYDTSNNLNYIIRNVSNKYPLTFYDSSVNSLNTSVSNIVTFEPLNKNVPIIIYVSKGQDYSFNNNDFFRFYDSSFQLLNINHYRRITYDSSLTDVHSNFYFMNKQRYKFIATTDFCSNQPFRIYGNSPLAIDNSLNQVGTSFEITIPYNADNSINKLFYTDIDTNNTNDVCGNLFILKDVSYSYYYGDISFSITNYRDVSTTYISLKSYNFGYSTISGYGNISISNNNLFYYSDSCRYITLGYTIASYELLNKISAIDLSVNTNNSFKVGLNKNRHLSNSTFNYDLSYGLTIKDYIIIDISKNYPLRLLNREASNNIYIDETYQVNRLGIDNYIIDGINSKFYYGSLKIKVVSAFTLPVKVQFLSISNNNIDASYIATFIYDSSSTPLVQNHIVYDFSNNSRSYYDFSNTNLQVRNQYGILYNENSYSDASNILNLNLNTNYTELSYYSRDKLSNVLTHLVSITPSIDLINNELSNNFLNKPFYIYYNVIDYENNSIQNIRIINLNAGPIIEISNNYNNNSIFNFNINTNSNANSYNFYDDIKVYIYDKSKNKIFIPFEITLTGSYISNSNTRTRNTISKVYNYDTTLNNIQNNYYSTFSSNVKFDSNFNKIELTNIDFSSIIINNITTSLLTTINTITPSYKLISYYNNNDVQINITDSSKNFINKITFRKPGFITEFVIDNSFDASFIIYNFNLYTPETGSYRINVSLGLNPTKFFFNAYDTSLNTISISGNFVKPKFFIEPLSGSTDPTEYIDLSYIGNYDLTISTKSLTTSDYYWKTYGAKFFDMSITNITKTYTIRVGDTSSPSLTFYDISGKILTNLNYFKLLFPITRRFNLLEDICFARLSNFITRSNEYVENKPVLLYDDSSIYDLCKNDLSYSYTTSPNITFSSITNDLSINNSSISDASCIINYRLRDLCFNYSTGISLELNFINIPDIRLTGQSIVTLNYVNDLSYRDNGLTFITPPSIYTPTYIYSKTTLPINLTEASNLIINTSTYSITGTSDICFSRLGNNYFKYTIQKTGSPNIVSLQRLIKIVDISSPTINFPTINFTIDGSAGLPTNYTSISNIRNNNYSIDNSATKYIDLSFTVNTYFNDLSSVLYNFDLCDNYFNTSDLSFTLSVFNNSTSFVFSDISNYCDSSGWLNKVTYPVRNDISNSNYLIPITFKYTLIDGCNNRFVFNRIVNIRDDIDPSINFNFTTCYNNVNHIYRDYSYVQFANFNIDFSYVAFNYTKSQTPPNNNNFDFNAEINSIIRDYTISDNFGTIEKTPKNVTITVSGSSLLPNDNKIINISNPTNDNSINALFSKINTSFKLYYDISDNQNNHIQVIRNVNIVDAIGDPSRNFKFSYTNAINSLNISFGVTSLTMKEGIDISVNHFRLTNSDISYDISYRFVNINNTPSLYINSISGNGVYDPSALIYNLGPFNSFGLQAREFSHNMLYYPIKSNRSTTDISNYKILTVTLKNVGPIVSFGASNEITQQSYTPISDSAFIFGVTSFSKYDEFYYYRYKQTISYSGTNFKVILDSSLNVDDPASGTYNIIYYSKDSNNVDISSSRKLIVRDSQAPTIRTICGDNIYQTLNTVWTLDMDSVYIEYGALVYDSATKKSSYFNNQTSSSTTLEISGSLYNPYKLIDGIKYSISYRKITPTTNGTISYSTISYSLISTANPDICYQVIYSIYDLCDNETSATRIINILRNYRPLLYPYIEIDITTLQASSKYYYYLLKDLSNVDISLTRVNKFIPSNGILDISYDLSLSFVNNNTKIITCEAIKPIVFNKTMKSNYIRFKLHAKSYDGSRNSYDSSINSTISTYVDYSINSLKVFNSTIDYQVITFYAIDNCQNILTQQQNSITFYLKIIHTKPYTVKKLININFTDPNRLEYPLLSSLAISRLISDINYFDSYENTYLNYINYYKKVRALNYDTSNIVLIDPGINIDDIVDGSVNYINGLFEPSNNTYVVSDISLTYFKAPSYIDVSNVLTLSGVYIQNYNIKDKIDTILDVSRIIIVKSFRPVIRLNYQKDANSNDYVSYLSQKYEKYIEKNGYVRDFSDIDICFTKVNIDYTNLNENSDGSYTLVYSVTNSSNIQGTAKRNVEVYSPIVLEKNVKINFVNLLTNTTTFNNNSKFSLGNGIYKFDVSTNYAFKLVTRDFDTSMAIYDVSNLINLTSDTSYNVNGENYYYGNNVTLTISGNFERCSLKFYPNTSSTIANPFKSYLKNNEFRYFFIYDNANYFINLQSYYNNLRDVNNVIDSSKSFIVDVSNLNNSVSSLPPFFTINGLKQDLHLTYGVYRFQQTTFKNFYNAIKFSTTPDGTHNGGIEYTNTVFTQNLPGVSRPLLSSYNTSSIYTQISINATTPTILYYYSEKFKNMGGKIIVKNNIVFLKNVTILNSFILTNQTRILFNDSGNFLNTSNEVMKNRIVLNQRFDASLNSVTVNTISNINICCVTQQNLRYNILYDLNQHPNRLVFQKYNEMSNNNINIGASPYYLLDVSNNNSSFNANYNSYITYFNSIYESSFALIKNPDLTDYDRSLKNVFYNSAIYNSNYTINTNSNTSITSANNATSATLLNNEIFNYINFFKRNNVIPSKVLVKDFSYSISEFLFARPSALLNLGSSNIYNYSSVNTSYLLAPRIKATNIIDNYAMFTLDVDYANLRFQNFEVLVYSSSFTTFPNSSTSISMDRVIFYSGSLVIANNMLYSTYVSGFYDGSSIFNKIYATTNENENENENETLTNRETTIQNMVFLNIIDASSTSSICGLTKQNIYNNMYLDESNNFIFHKYNERTIVNYQVNDSNLTLAKTLRENSNNDYYLLDVCSNSFYNSFNNDGLTVEALESLVNNTNYSIALSYKIYDEVDVSINFNMLASLYILPLYINNIPIYRRTNNVYSTEYNYNTGSYSITNNGIISEISINAISTSIYGNYNSSSKTILNGLHSNTYLLDLNDYFDINLVVNRFQSASTDFTTNNINPKNLIYTLVDLSYINKFSLINSETSYNIVYDKVNITILNSMQIKVFCLHFKFVYLFTILNRIWNKRYTPKIIPYNMTDNIQIYSDFYRDYNFTNTSFKSTLNTSGITLLYRELINSIIGYITIYNDLIANYELFIKIVIVINPIYNTYTFNTLILAQLVEDINKLVENIDTIILSEVSKLQDSLLLPDSTIFTEYNDINNIEYTLSSFFMLYNISQISIYRWNSTFNTNYSISVINYPNFTNMFDMTNLNPTIFLTNFKYNLNSLTEYLNEVSTENSNGGLQVSINNNSNIDLQLASVTNFTQFIEKITSLLNHLAPLINNYNAFEVASNNIRYINNDFELTGSKILIYSNLSNNINIKFNIKYKSNFFSYIDISTIDLDIIIPDLTPPTLTFKNNDFSFNQNDFIDSSINSVITNLIRDVSYIDLNQSYDLSINNTYYSYYTDVTDVISSNNIQNSLVSIDFPSTNLDFGTNMSLFIDILYTVKDNANNINTIIRKLIINKSDDGPKFFYFNNGSVYEKLSRLNPIHKLTIDENITIEKFKAELTNFIVIIDPRLALSNSYLTNTSIGVSEFEVFYSRSVLDINVINIFDLSNSAIKYASYDVTNNKFMNSNGQELANSSKIILKVGSYNLIYISKTSSITNRSNSESRILTIKEVIVIEETAIPTHCCYPKVEYKPIQDNYKLGSQNSTVMKRAKYIINRNR